MILNMPANGFGWAAAATTALLGLYLGGGSAGIASGAAALAVRLGGRAGGALAKYVGLDPGRLRRFVAA